MRKIHSLLIFIFSVYGLGAQTYYKMLPTDTMVWQHFNCVAPVKMQNPNALYLWDYPVAALGTATINSLTYKQVYQLSQYSVYYPGKTLIGYMREDTLAKKVFFRETPTSTEILLYDFSLNTGDSVMLNIPNDGSMTGYYRADSIVVKNVSCGPRKHFYMRKHVNNPDPLNYFVFIESIGSTFHALYPYAVPMMNFCQLSPSPSCNHPWHLGLSCKHNNLNKQFQSCTFVLAQINGCMNPVDSCNYRNICGGIRSNSSNGMLKIYPNPVNDNITVTLDAVFNGNVILQMYDLVGKMIHEEDISKKQNETREINLRTGKLENGIYFLKVHSNNRSYVQEFIVSH